MSNISLQGNNKWTASSVFDETQEKGQDALNAVTAALDALKAAGNNGKLIGIENGAFTAVELTAWTGGSY